MRDMNEATYRLIVREAVEETLTRLGFNVHEPNDIQADLIFLRKSRMGNEEVHKWAKRSALGVSISAGCLALWEGVKKLLHI